MTRNSVIEMVTTFAFVPVVDTIRYFHALAAYSGDEEQPVLDYFETTYVGKLRRVRRLQPLFPHGFWNMNVRVKENLPRTYKISEV